MFKKIEICKENYSFASMLYSDGKIQICNKMIGHLTLLCQHN